MADARLQAAAALVAIERGAVAGRALDDALVAVDDVRDRALVTELVYGITRRRDGLDAELRRFCTRPLQQLDPGVRAALRLGLYQLRHLRVPAYAAVSGAVDVARTLGRPAAAGFVNAVLRRAAGAGAGQAAADHPSPPVAPGDAEAPSSAGASIQGGTAAAPVSAAEPIQGGVAAPFSAAALAESYSHPEWLVRRWLQRLGPEETAALLVADNTPPAVTLRPNRLRTTAAALLAELAAAGVPASPGLVLAEAVRLGRVGSPGALAALTEGRCTVQGEASMLVGALAAPPPGSFCLEVAAAPGGKATDLAERMGDVGTVIANDSDPRGAAACLQAARRLGLSAVQGRTGDARALPEAFRDRCDLVLADVPCSGLGTLAARPDLRWRRQEGDIASIARLQAQILEAAGRCVKPGGRLVYSTCTTEPEENEAIVAGFLAAFPVFTPLDVRAGLPAGAGDQPAALAGMVRLWPQRQGCDGFFVAVLRRDG